MNFQTGLGLCRSDQANDNLEGLQRHTLPRAGDMTEKTVLDLVPLTRPRWIVTQIDLQSSFVGELLQSPSPQAGSRTVAPTAISGYQKSFCSRVAFSAH